VSATLEYISLHHLRTKFMCLLLYQWTQPKNNFILKLTRVSELFFMIRNSISITN